MSIFIIYAGQRSKNVHNVRKVCLETTLCVLGCFVEFYVFIFYTIDVEVFEHIWTYSSLKNLVKHLEGQNNGSWRRE